MKRPVGILLLAIVAAVIATAAAAWPSGATGAPGGGKIVAVGAQSQYADVIAQVGGKYVQASAIMSNPNTDPHSFEASIAIAREVGDARLVVQNGLGYDSFMDSIESATPSSGRTVISVQRLLKLPDSTPNPHLWYDPATMPKVAVAVAASLSVIQPAHAAYFKANAAAFTASMKRVDAAIASFRSAHSGVPVAVSEPVADYLLTALGADNKTPWTFQSDVMNGVDPSPQNVAAQRSLFTERKVRVFLYNQQVTDALTGSFITLARQNHIPVVGVNETMPAPGYDYQTWMLSVVRDLRLAVAHG
ncbi:cation ABC transporter substrate-binding protein [Trebonia kvetii]|uniref:Cation ABC transporter substrate-binding protein n=1 Tax=Trebonia kvetii TaxID=2480626 RepID=A0A6P2BMB4_9ACTN|nr:zinc ABC transporter substrate-binding protein [Trebonia kvetii]TVY99704.1 cation ABC transporter substrate-binding protein [Trebonia kvetii]